MSQMDLFSSLLSKPVNLGGPRVVSEEHDRTKIKSEARDRRMAWDASEYGVTRAQALTMSGDAVAALADRRANLADTADGRIACMVAGEAAWHGLGVQVADAVNAADALRLAGLAGWDLEKVPTFAEVNGQRVETGGFAVVRKDTPACIGYGLGGRYTIVSNEECFDFVDEVIGGSGGLYESAGALGKGEKVWMLAKMPGVDVVRDGDELERYLMLATSHDGSGSVKFYPSSQRVVCQNTYRASMASYFKNRKLGRALAMRHTPNIKRNIEAARQAVGLASEGFEEFAEVARGLARKQMDPKQLFRSMLDVAIGGSVAGQPVTQAGIDSGALARSIAGLKTEKERADESRKLERYEVKRGELFTELLTRYEGEKCGGDGSAWAAVNAVSEYADHSGKVHYRGTTQERAENRLLSVVDGRAQELTQAAVQFAINA